MRGSRLVSDPATIDRHGEPGGPLVIALHGAAVNRKTWLPLARVLPAHFELWCPDLPGHGCRRDEPFTREASLDTIAALVASARPRRVILAGDSLGGYLALEAAARTPHGIAGVVAGGCTWSMTGLGGALARLSDSPVRALETLAGVERCERWFAALVSAVLRGNGGSDARSTIAAGLRLRARTESLTELRGLDLVRLVRDIRSPIRFVNGALDWPTRAGEGGLVKAARAATVTLAARCGHGVGIFAPGVFANACASAAAHAFVADRRPGEMR